MPVNPRNPITKRPSSRIARSDPFPAEGEMARRIRAFDWSQHPLGPIDQWSGTLRTAVRIMLSSPHAMWIGWEGELYVFCNDACRATLRLPADQAPGRPAREVFAGCWEEFGPRVESLLSQPDAAVPKTVRWKFGPRDELESSVRTFSCNPLVDDDDGEIRGVTCVVAEAMEAAEPDATLAGGRLAPGELARQGGVAVYICDLEGRITYFNRRAVELWGCEPQSGDNDRRFCGSFRLWRPDGTPLPHEHTPMAIAVREGRPVRNEEIVIEQPDGQRATVSVTIDPLHDGSGRRTGAINVFVDVTGRRRVEAALHASEERLRLATQTGKIGLWEWDIIHDRLTWTDSLYPIHGVDPATFDATVQGFAALVHPDDRTMVDEAIRRALREGVPYELEFRVLRPDGTTVWIFTNAIVVAEDGRPARMIGASVDVTERKRAAEALQESEQRFVRFMHHLPGLAWIKDEDGRYVFVNDAAVRAFGQPAEALLGRTDAEIFPADAAGQFQRNDRLALASEGGVQTVESLHHYDDGQVRHSLVSKFPIPAAGGGAALVGGMAIDITEQRDAELATQRLAAIVESSEDAILSKTLEGVITSWNRGAERVFGYTAAEMVGQPVLRLIPPDRHGDQDLILGRLRRGEAIESYETVRVRKDGARIDVSLSVSPLRNASGAIVGASKIARDITERRQAEEKLRLRSERMQLLSELLSDLLTARDPDAITRGLFPKVSAHLGAEAYFNFMVDDSAGVLRLHSCAGIPEETAQSIGILKFGEAICGTVAQSRMAIVADDIQNSDYDKAALVRGWGIQTYACNPLMVGDRLLGTLSFASRTRPRFDDDELEFLRVVSQSAAVAIDRLRATESLRDSEERFRTLADNIAQFAWTADAQGWIFWYNHRWFDFTGTTLPEMEGWGWRKVHHPDHVDRVVAEFARCIDEGEVWEDTFPLRRHDGEYRWFLSRAVPIRDSAGRVVRWFGTNTDITEQREAEVALERARDEAVAASRAKDDFLAALSHELRTPLNPVLLLASDAVENPALPENMRADFEIIRKNISLEARLIDDLLDLTRITRGKLRLDLGDHDAHAILRDALATIQPDAAEKEVGVTLELQAESALVRGDPVRLQQVFWNVLKNAVKFTPEGGRIGIATRTDEQRRRIEVTVTDSGIGLAPEEIARIFDAFSQGDHANSGFTHRFGGLGLGLAISRMVLELHGGSIRASSAGPGQGATFAIELPLAPAPESGERPPTASAPAAPSTAHEARAGGRILLVEDHAPTRTALERLLLRRQFTVTSAGSLAEARKLARAGQFELLISDIGLPDGSGCDLMEELARDRGLVGIALTGYGMEQDIARSRTAGFSAHLTKPVSIEALDRAVAEVFIRETAG